MSTRIRLRRLGAKKRPYFRVVVADQRSPRDGRFIENIGKYHPLEDPSLIEIDEERALHWLRTGAQPSNQVRNLMSKIGIWDKFVAERPNAAIPVNPGRAEKPAKEKVSKKAASKAASKAAAAAPVDETPEPTPEPSPEPIPEPAPEPVPSEEQEPVAETVETPEEAPEETTES
ncbi:MAG TPA: 30S ribosomal protein S16 [Actinomycetota bacterium]|jgi:small subunit ribosomal protein S16|nr:30S ribosomal protein S16 [Actinomycetota bacterium]